MALQFYQKLYIPTRDRDSRQLVIQLRNIHYSHNRNVSAVLLLICSLLILPLLSK